MGAFVVNHSGTEYLQLLRLLEVTLVDTDSSDAGIDTITNRTDVGTGDTVTCTN